MTDQETRDRTITELKDFAQRLNQIREELVQLRETVLGTGGKGLTWDRDGLTAQFEILEHLAESLKPAALDLVRHASQMLEHQRLEWLERVVLRRQLAECENALTALDATIGLCRHTHPLSAALKR
jgi:hypothetical protein